MKTCNKCGISKSEDSFYLNGKFYKAICKMCEKEADRINYAKNKKQRLNRIKQYKRDNPRKLYIYQRQRLINKLKRTPVYADLEAIKEFYVNCPKGMEVDHIIPLQGKTVSGFHILPNLQYLTVRANRKKKNKFPYYPLEFYREKGLIF